MPRVRDFSINPGYERTANLRTKVIVNPYNGSRRVVIEPGGKNIYNPYTKKVGRVYKNERDRPYAINAKTRLPLTRSELTKDERRYYRTPDDRVKLHLELQPYSQVRQRHAAFRKAFYRWANANRPIERGNAVEGTVKHLLPPQIASLVERPRLTNRSDIARLSAWLENEQHFGRQNNVSTKGLQQMLFYVYYKHPGGHRVAGNPRDVVLPENHQYWQFEELKQEFLRDKHDSFVNLLPGLKGRRAKTNTFSSLTKKRLPQYERFKPSVQARMRARRALRNRPHWSSTANTYVL